MRADLDQAKAEFCSWTLDTGFRLDTISFSGVTKPRGFASQVAISGSTTFPRGRTGNRFSPILRVLPRDSAVTRGREPCA